MTSIDDLPWYLRAKIIGMAGMDTQRALGIAPGKLAVDVTTRLQTLLGFSDGSRLVDRTFLSGKWRCSSVVIAIRGTNRLYQVNRHSIDDIQLEHDVCLRNGDGTLLSQHILYRCPAGAERSCIVIAYVNAGFAQMMAL